MQRLEGRVDSTISALMERPKAVTEYCRHSLGCFISNCTLAEIVDLKFFCWFSFVEIPAMRDASERTVKRNGGRAQQIYLHRQIRIDLSL
jgi:hypothetical protein